MLQLDHRRIDRLLLYPFALCLLLIVSGCSVSYSIDVKDEQKISDSSGNFSGELDAGDQFGFSIANIGDLEGDGVTDIAVGAPFDDDDGSNRGAVWVLFLDSDGQVDIHQKISDSEGDFSGSLDNEDQFGRAIAPMGDLNGDGFLDIAVAAPLDDDGGANKGAVWILFLNGDGTVQSEQKISEDSGDFDESLSTNDQFGYALANIGDLDSDGVTDLAVGVPYDDDGGTDQGAVWILFLNSDGTVKSTQKISSTSGDLNNNLNDEDHFGSAVSEIGDLDGDGVTDLAVGLSGRDLGGTNRGAVWILFMQSDGTVASVTRIGQDLAGFTGELSNNDQFGEALSNIGDINSDGIEDLVVGAPQSTDSGAFWILFLTADGDVHSSSKISETEGNFSGGLDSDDQFGGSIALLGDLDGDTVNDLAVGACLDDDGGIDKGSIWILFMNEVDIDRNQQEGGLFNMSQKDLNYFFGDDSR
jgi:hypothetical protein